MATRSFQVTARVHFNQDANVIQWSGLLQGDDGEPFEMPSMSDRSVQVHGTFGAGGTLVIEGSNDGVNYFPLTDPQGNALSFTSAKIEQVSEITLWLRPRVTAGDGTTSLTVTMLARRSYAS